MQRAGRTGSDLHIWGPGSRPLDSKELRGLNADTASIRQQGLLRRSFTIFLVALIIIVMAFLAVFAVSLYQSGRENAVSKATALEQYVRRSLEVSAVVAEDALGYLRRRGTLDGLAQDREAHEYLASLVARMSNSEGMAFVDRSGTVTLYSGSFPAAPVDLSDRTWFHALADGDDRFIDGGLLSRVTGTVVFVYTAALRDADGTFLGAVNIGLPSNVVLGGETLPFEQEGIVTKVFKESGELLARYPFPAELIGSRVSFPAGFQDGAAVLEARPIDGRRSLTAYNAIEGLGLVASVSVPLAVVFQPLFITAAGTLPLLALFVIGAIVTLRQLEAQQRQIARSATRLETVLQASSLGAWQCLPKSDRTDYFGRWGDMVGYGPEDLTSGRVTWESLLHPEERGHLLDRYAELLAGQIDTFHEEHRMRHRDGHWIWVLDSCRVVERDAEGNAQVVIGIHLDISDRREAEERMRAVSLEVDHRSKNLLAVVQALVSMSKVDTEETFKATLRGRIQALSRAHELLSRSRWKGADLRVIAEEELGPYTAEQRAEIVIAGPSVVLGASAIQALAMTLHELATNAAKYGALSVPGGRLMLTWSLPEGAPTFVIRWEEKLPHPLPRGEATKGFGSRLMHLMIDSQLGGKLERDQREDGMSCLMTLPRSLLLPSGAGEPDATPAPDRGAPPNGTGGGRRVLLVEDEALVAAETAARLAAAGHAVEATAATLRDAVALAGEADVDAAVLDLNLGGTMSFPAARRLQDRGIPFVFLTGYQHEGLIPRGFEGVTVLRKPCPPEVLESAVAGLPERTVPTPSA
jgi:PAS domain S-box-containing protein